MNLKSIKFLVVMGISVFAIESKAEAINFQLQDVHMVKINQASKHR